MSDLKQQLLKYGDISSRGKDNPQNVACREALERIEALEAALKPFADEMEKRAFKTHPHWPDSQAFIGFNFTIGDLRRAASLLEEKK